MITPAGKECRYYYEDFHRGRNVQECRLIKQSAKTQHWKPNDCEHCPVPAILWANASEHLDLKARVTAGFIGLGRKVEVTAWCRKHDMRIDDPYVGCEQCRAEKPQLSDFLSPEDDQ
ncbi:MAG: hypothetical protein JXJ17_10165 [Anaerolineae bacterium]|nr:hypothetical protein [Anaerolineae bacterium]